MRRPLLFPFNPLYALAVGIRNKLFDKGILKSIRFETPTLVIGNLSAGGTGKTPHTEYILRLFEEKKTAVISRGYGRKTKGFIWVEVDSNAKDVGDEPLQMKRKFPNIPFAVCEDRVLAVPELINEFPDTELIIFDDAFQHRYLDGKCKVMLSTWQDLFTRDTFLPAGNLRESKNGASRADIILVSKCPENSSQEDVQIIEKEIRKFAQAPIFFSRFVASPPVFPLGENLTEPSISEKDVFIFSAIAGGSQWANAYLPRFKNKVGELCYRDHHAFSIHDIRLLRKKWEVAGKPLLLTTEKDWMRIQPFQEEMKEMQLMYYPIEVELLENAPSFKAQLEHYLFDR